MSGENYIKRLERENAELRAAAQNARDAITAFKIHLFSEKFYNDPTIQVKDVDLRLTEIANTLNVG
jgi:hypothetical protein